MIVLDEVTKTYAAQRRPVVDRLSLRIEDGMTVVLLGASGCGKTTVLKMIDRMIEPTSGRIAFDGESIETLPKVALRRSIGHVFQAAALFPHMTIGENVGILMTLEKVPKREVLERVDELLFLVGLDPKRYRHRFPSELSGGQQQRVGVARALSMKPKYLLMDEPFGALDTITRRNLQDELKRLREKFGITILFVTHDILEAVSLGDRVAVMNAGRIEQLGSAEDIVQRPATAYVEELFAQPFAEMRRLTNALLA